MTHIYKTLLDILESQSFELLEPFKQTAVWSKFGHEERVLFARLLVMQGSRQLQEGDQQVLESFEIACKISSDDPEILFQQGTILSSYRENIRCLNLAYQAFTEALKKNPHFSKVLYHRAQVLIDIGLFKGEVSCFIEAIRNFEKAITLLDSAQDEVDRMEFHWKWGYCLSALGRVSGEPFDFHQSIQQYQLSYQLGCRHPGFLNDFGHSYANLAALLNNSAYFLEALKLFNRAVLEDSEEFEGWYNQACCLQSLLEFSYHDQFSDQAHRSFEKASQLNPECSQLWLNWGHLDIMSGKIKNDRQRVESSLAKFAKGHELEPNHPQMLSHWADAELYLGVHAERLDLIQASRAKIVQSLEMYSEDPDVWYLYGSCLNELGHYFSEESYYHQAIEKFQYGLSLKRQYPILWYGLALTFYALGELTAQDSYFERSLRYFSKAAEHQSNGFSQFWNDWGVALSKYGEITQQASYVEHAIEKFERALKQPIQNIEIQDVDLEWIYNFGCAYDLLGDLKEDPSHIEKSICILTQILKLDPNYSQARYNLALAFSHLGETVTDVDCFYKAAEHFEYLLSRDPEEDSIHMDYGVTLTNLAILLQDVHFPERSDPLFQQAENHFMQAAALGNTQTFYPLAGLYSITKKYDQAMQSIERAQDFGALPVIEDLLHDEWLEGLRHFPAFQQFLSELTNQRHSSTDEK